MRYEHIRLIGGCSTPEKPVLPALLDQELGRLAIICEAHPPEEGVTIETLPDVQPQEQLNRFCIDCPLNMNPPQRDTKNHPLNT